MVHAWRFLGSTTMQRIGKLTLREALAMALDDRITVSVSKVALLAAALTLSHRP